MSNENELRKGSLSSWWIDQLSTQMEKLYPDIIGHYYLVDHWKRDGWNDGTTTLFGVYEKDGQFVQVSFPDYGDATKDDVTPKFEHTGWAGKS